MVQVKASELPKPQWVEQDGQGHPLEQAHRALRGVTEFRKNRTRSPSSYRSSWYAQPQHIDCFAKDHWLIQWRPIKEGRAVAAKEFTFSGTPKSRLPAAEWHGVDWVEEFAD